MRLNKTMKDAKMAQSILFTSQTLAELLCNRWCCSNSRKQEEMKVKVEVDESERDKSTNP